MISLKKIVASLFLSIGVAGGVQAQTMDCAALKSFAPGVQRGVYEVCSHVNLDADRQVQVAKMVEASDAMFVKLITADGGVLSAKSRNQIEKFRTKELKRILSEEELMDYYRGVYDAEAEAQANEIANKLQAKYNLTDQNWKFIKVAMFKMIMDTNMLKKVYADKPKVAAAKIKELRKTQLKSIEDKGGICIDPEEMTVTVLREFNPNALHRE